MWQRARLLWNDPPDQQEQLLGLVGEPPVGFTFWVRATRPDVAMRDDASFAELTKPGEGNGYVTNIRSLNGRHALTVNADAVELLAEFSNAPTLIAWGSWADGTSPER